MSDDTDGNHGLTTPLVPVGIDKFVVYHHIVNGYHCLFFKFFYLYFWFLKDTRTQSPQCCKQWNSKSSSNWSSGWSLRSLRYWARILARLFSALPSTWLSSRRLARQSSSNSWSVSNSLPPSPIPLLPSLPLLLFRSSSNIRLHHQMLAALHAISLFSRICYSISCKTRLE